jgi:hypothetical protein
VGIRVQAQGTTVLVLSRHKAEQVEVVGKVAADTLDLDHIPAESDRSLREGTLQWLEVDIPGIPTGDTLVEVVEEA